MEKQQYPLISCLCVTRRKYQILERAIACFNHQSYAPRQLVVVYEEAEADLQTRDYIESLTSNPDIKVAAIPVNQPKLTLGELRNISVRVADGKYVCVWDDDDWYGSDRLEIQMKYLQDAGKQASVLLRWIIYDATTRKSYLSLERTWEESLLCSKTLLEANPYPAMTQGEDTPVIAKLMTGGYMALIQDEPEIYVYHYHGENTWSELHFRGLIHSSIELPDKINQEIIRCITL
jgi:glycosyltransferase involved in cell wall biosynthesis